MRLGSISTTTTFISSTATEPPRTPFRINLGFMSAAEETAALAFVAAQEERCNVRPLCDQRQLPQLACGMRVAGHVGLFDSTQPHVVVAQRRAGTAKRRSNFLGRVLHLQNPVSDDAG